MTAPAKRRKPGPRAAEIVPVVLDSSCWLEYFADTDLSLALEEVVNGLPMADSLIYATARRHRAVLWTQDAHLEGLPGVQFFRKP